MPIIFEPPAALLVAQSAGSLGSPGDGSGMAPNGGSQVWIAASPANGSLTWGGCQVWLSFDDTTYAQIGTITSRANQGALTASLAAPPGANPDTTDTLAVDLSMSGGALPTGSDADAQAGRTLCYVDGELTAFGLATPTTGDAYNLTDLYRALYGSTGRSHASGAGFVLLDDNIFKYNLPPSYAGQTLYFKFASFNAWGAGVQDLSTLTAVTYTPTGGVVPSGVITGGDASVSASGVITLDTVNSNIGTFQGLTVNAKGLVTGAVNESYLTGNQTLTLSGDVSGSGATAITTSLAATGVTAASYTYGSFTVDAKGRVTAASNGIAPVTSISGTSPISSSGGTTPAISLVAGALPNGMTATTQAAGDNSTKVATTAYVVSGSPVSANPTSSLGLSAVNGSATTFMRSDGAPALSQSIAPTWTASHVWNGSGINLTIEDSVSADQGIAEHYAYESVWRSYGSYPENQFYCFGGTVSTPAAVTSSQNLGDFLWHGYDGSASQIGARILATTNGTVSAGVVPGRLIFYTGNSSGVLTQALSIDSTQNVNVGPSVSQKIADANGILYTKVYTISTLPTGLSAGARAMVSNGVAVPTLAAAVGSTTGSQTDPVYYDGAVWRYG